MLNDLIDNFTQFGVNLPRIIALDSGN